MAKEQDTEESSSSINNNNDEYRQFQRRYDSYQVLKPQLLRQFENQLIDLQIPFEKCYDALVMDIQIIYSRHMNIETRSNSFAVFLQLLSKQIRGSGGDLIYGFHHNIMGIWINQNWTFNMPFFKRMIQTALDIQERFGEYYCYNTQQRLNCSIGIGFGELKLMFVGTDTVPQYHIIFGGNAMEQASQANYRCNQKQVVMSKELRDKMNNDKGIECTPIYDCFQVTKIDSIRIARRCKYIDTNTNIRTQEIFSFGNACIPLLSYAENMMRLPTIRWCGQQRPMSIVSIQLTMDYNSMKLEEIQFYVKTIQKIVYENNGQIYCVNVTGNNNKSFVLAIFDTKYCALKKSIDRNHSKSAIISALKIYDVLGKTKKIDIGIVTDMTVIEQIGGRSGRREIRLDGMGILNTWQLMKCTVKSCDNGPLCSRRVYEQCCYNNDSNLFKWNNFCCNKVPFDVYQVALNPDSTDNFQVKANVEIKMDDESLSKLIANQFYGDECDGELLQFVKIYCNGESIDVINMFLEILKDVWQIKKPQKENKLFRKKKKKKSIINWIKKKKKKQKGDNIVFVGFDKEMKFEWDKKQNTLDFSDKLIPFGMMNHVIATLDKLEWQKVLILRFAAALCRVKDYYNLEFNRMNLQKLVSDLPDFRSSLMEQQESDNLNRLYLIYGYIHEFDELNRFPLDIYETILMYHDGDIMIELYKTGFIEAKNDNFAFNNLLIRDGIELQMLAPLRNCVSRIIVKHYTDIMQKTYNLKLSPGEHKLKGRWYNVL